MWVRVSAVALLIGAWACAPLIGLEDADQLADGGLGDGAAAGGSGGTTDCWGSEYKICDGHCREVDDPDFGCSATACAPCALPFADATCQAERCEIAACHAGHADCDIEASNHAATGCETDVRTHPEHCGGCGIACAASDPTKNWFCHDGVCKESDCPIGSANCGPNGECESISTETAQCGACDAACNLPNAIPKCVSVAGPAAAQCAIDGCQLGWADCDGTAATGCETNVTNDLAHCGACGTPCIAPVGGIATCNSGACSFDCVNPSDECGNVCVDRDTDVHHCGDCDNACIPPAGGTMNCVNGNCYKHCPAPLTLCDTLCANLKSDDKHCGSCTQPCVGGKTCNNGSCG